MESEDFVLVMVPSLLTLGEDHVLNVRMTLAKVCGRAIGSFCPSIIQY